MEFTKKSDIIDLVLRETSFVMSQQLVDLLKVSTGERVAIGFTDNHGVLCPIIYADGSGNKLNGTNTVSFRGKQHGSLAQFGTNFWAKEQDGLILLEGDGVPIYTEVNKAVEAFISKDIILDTNYDITKITNYEF